MTRMDDPLLLLYTILPCVVAGYGVAVFLAPRLMPVALAWIVALALAALFTLTAIVVMRRASGGVVPFTSMLKAYASLYGVPLIALTAIALRLRTHFKARPVGLVVVLLVAVAVTVASQYASGYFLDFVNASG